MRRLFFMRQFIALFLVLTATYKTSAQVNAQGLDTTTNVYKWTDELPKSGYNVDNHIWKHIKYPTEARSKGMHGTVYIRTIVRKDGKVDNPSVVRSSGSEDLDNEALRVISELPDWKTPARVGGKNVDVYYTFPVTFKL